MSEALPCIVCKTALSNIDETGNQPSGGLAFTTPGHYGTTLFDPMDGNLLEINICDPCLLEAGEGGRVFTTARAKSPRKYTKWTK